MRATPRLGIRRDPARRRAAAVYEQRRYHARGAGRWEPFTDTEPVRDHVDALPVAAAKTLAEIATQTGVSCPPSPASTGPPGSARPAADTLWPRAVGGRTPCVGLRQKAHTPVMGSGQLHS